VAFADEGYEGVEGDRLRWLCVGTRLREAARRGFADFPGFGGCGRALTGEHRFALAG
jgi:hypothetical protein